MVPRLLAAGHSVRGWNRTAGKTHELEQLGMEVATSPADASKDADVVLSIVTDGAAVEAIALGENGIAHTLLPEAIYLDMSTISPDTSRRIGGEFSARGRIMMDAPLSGSPVTVREGKASVMVAGDPDAYEKVKDVLTAIGPKVSYKIGRAHV